MTSIIGSLYTGSVPNQLRFNSRRPGGWEAEQLKLSPIEKLSFETFVIPHVLESHSTSLDIYISVKKSYKIKPKRGTCLRASLVATPHWVTGHNLWGILFDLKYLFRTLLPHEEA